MKTKRKNHKVEDYRRWAAEGLTQKETAVKANRTVACVNRMANLNDIRFRKAHPVMRADFDEFLRLVGEGWTSAELAEHFGASRNTVLRWAREWEVKVNHKWQKNRRPRCIDHAALEGSDD